MNTSRLLVVVVALQSLILLGQWTGLPALSGAQAQVSDPAAQRIAQIDELKAINVKMEKIIGILEGGNLQVKLANSDEKQ
ncbi:MAG: hypothetical protein IT448_00495 [Phycisphaerales bacterium]|nr:hypothetical protein [Phycisphaerales bacterium]